MLRIDARVELSNDSCFLITNWNLVRARTLKLLKPSVGICILINRMEDILRAAITPATANS